MKQSSDKVASFYFGEKTKPLKQFQTAAKVLFNQKETAPKENVAPKNDERPTLNDIDQRAQQILKEVCLENRRPKKDEGLVRLYGKLNSDGTLTLQFDKKFVNAETLTTLENLAAKMNGTVSIENDSYNFNFKNVDDLAVFSRAVRTAFYGERSIPVRDNKAATNVAGIELPQGYKTETGKPLAESNNRDFIVDENGNKDFGNITSEIENATNGIVKAAPIRLQVGSYDFGYIHLAGIHLQEIQNKGFDNPIAYVKHILQKFSKIYSRADTGNINRFILCVEGATVKKSKDFMPIDLELEKGADGYYAIVSSYPKKDKKIEGLLLFDGSTGSSPVIATGSLVRLADDKSGVSYQGANAISNIPSTGVSPVDGSTGSSPVTATGSLVRLADDKSDVSYHGANAMSNTPSLVNISQSANEGKAENLKWIEQNKFTYDEKKSVEENIGRRKKSRRNILTSSA